MSRLRLLHVEDEPNARLMLRDLLDPEEVDLVSVESAEEALAACREAPFDLTLLDWMLPGLDGGAFLRAVREHGRAGRVVVLTADGRPARAVEAVHAGAYDFLVKPADPDALLDLVSKARRSVQLVSDAGRARPRVACREAAAAERILGSSAEVLSLKARLELVAASDAAVLIAGESGTGKELVAQALHEASGRHRGRLVTVNCAAVPDALFESELFGHKRGAFTGADADRPGLIELASGGTLFLDEVGELSPAAQAKLLRVLQERRLRRVGERQDRPVDVRPIAATHRDLEQEVDRGAFRQDLLFRLDVVRLEVPPLRERLSDLPQLLDHFLTQGGAVYDRPVPHLTPEQLSFLQSLEWPGNVRELQSVAKRLLLLGPDVALADLRRRARRQSAPDERPQPQTPAPDGAAPTPEDVVPLKEALRAATRDAVLLALRATEGNRTQAAQLLGVSRKTLFNKMQELGIKEESSWS